MWSVNPSFMSCLSIYGKGLGINYSAVYCTVDSVIQFSQPLTVTDSQWCYLGSGSVFIFSCGHWPESTSWNAYIYLFLLIIYYESEISNSCSFIHLLLLWICFNSFSSGYKYNTPPKTEKQKLGLVLLLLLLLSLPLDLLRSLS